jgi:transcriptional regulator with XRE-family HTH domain/tetratricopeptide (TPR) repeat protein
MADSLLKQERLNRHWSRAQVESLTGIPQRSLENWEKEIARPREENVRLLCELYGKNAKQLGLDGSRDIMGVEKNAPTSNQEETPIMSDLIRRQLFSNLGSKLTSLIDTWPKRNYRYEELQGEINKAIFDSHVFAPTDSIAEIGRREALKSMALVPVLLLGSSALISTPRLQKTDTDLLLKHCAAGLTAAWYLRRGRDLAFVSDLVSTYISILQPLVYSYSEAHRKASATLLAQSFMLKSHLGSEEYLAFTEQAVYYSDLSEDSAIQALAYRRRANEQWEIKNYKDALQDAEKGYGLARSNKAIPKIIHSVTAAGLSLCQAAYGKTDDARSSLTEARTLFDPTMPVPSISYTESILTAISGGIYRQIGLWGEATTLYEESLNIPDISALGAVQQRIDYAKTEICRDDQPRDMDLCVKLLTEAITRAEELNSTIYIRKARECYDMLRLVWPREDAIKKLGKDHFGSEK